MEAEETRARCGGYGKPPWRFKGSALYQLHLVKSEVARALIPKEFRLVEAFGYTLGGFFLANYDDSPAGVFDELVVIAGIVWNPPTSCAWASKVLVNSSEACLHGRKDVGLPSDVAKFSKLRCCPEQRITAKTWPKESRHNGILNMIGFSSSISSPKFHLDTEVTEINGPAASVNNIFRINLVSTVPKEYSKAWLGPPIKMTLPSFSGRTEYNPTLLKYSCQVECRVRVVQPLEIFGPPATEQKGSEELSSNFVHPAAAQEATEKRSRLSLDVMLSKPILALEFNCLNMNVEAPLVVSH